jgi:flagellar protein FliO/FliZ
MKLLKLLGVSIGVLPALVGAASTQADSASKLPASSIGASTALEMAAMLTGVILLILVLAWLMKRMGSFPSAGKGMVKILGGVSLGPRERAVVLEAGKKRILVGVAPGRVQTLCHLDGSDEDTIGEFSDQLDAQLQSDEK